MKTLVTAIARLSNHGGWDHKHIATPELNYAVICGYVEYRNATGRYHVTSKGLAYIAK